MAISFNTGATASASTATSCAITIPSGVLVGDLMLLGIACFTEDASQPAVSFSGGGGGWTLLSPMHDGTNPQAVNNGTLYNWAFVYYRIATAGDPGASLTVSESGSPGGTTWLALALASYTGAAATQPDVAGSNGANNVFSSTAPSETTATAGDWYVGMELGGTNNAPTGSPPGTQREIVTSGAGITASIWDGNGSAGPSGSVIGGGTVHGGSSAPNNTYSVFTIGLAPPASAGPSGTIQPRPTVPVPRGRPGRGLWRQITGPTATPAPPAGTLPPRAAIPVPRGRPGRAVIRGIAVPGIYGTAPPQEYQAAPRRRPGRGSWRGIAGQAFTRVRAPAQQYRTPPRRRRARALVGFRPVRTVNAAPVPRTLLISLASQGGTDDYGNSFPQGIYAGAGVIEGPEFIGADFIINSAGQFFYSGTPAAGKLVQSVTASLTGGTDAFGNHYVPLTGWYDNTGGFFTQLGAGFITFGTGSLSAGWTANSTIQNDASGNLYLQAHGSIYANGTPI